MLSSHNKSGLVNVYNYMVNVILNFKKMTYQALFLTIAWAKMMEATV